MIVDVSKEVTAAHEAGHATVCLAGGIPVQWVEVRPTQITSTVKRFGFTETTENVWMSTAPLSQQAKVLRRIVAKAGGMAGEKAAGVFDVGTSGDGAGDDIAQIGGGLVEIGLLAAGAPSTPRPFIAAAIVEAERIIELNRAFFDELRRDLLAHGRVDSPILAACWEAADEERFLLMLKPSV